MTFRGLRKRNILRYLSLRHNFQIYAKFLGNIFTIRYFAQNTESKGVLVK